MRFEERAALAAAVITVLFACARPYPPPGGEQDRLPPGVLSITPAPMSVGVAADTRVVIRFDERISEQGLEDAVLVSPRTSEPRVERGRSELRVSLRDGWEPGRIYHVIIQPVVRDLFQNTIGQPLEIVFSTGPEIPATALAGLVKDRLTGRPAAGAWIAAVREADSAAYGAMADTAGLFALRHLPAGAYRIRAFQDQNRDREADFREEQDSTALRLADGDTAVIALVLLLPDTTPARVIRAEALDSLQVRIHLDDHLDPAVGVAGISAVLRLLPDSSAWQVGRLMLPHEYDERQRALRAAADSARADSLAVAAADSMAAAADTAAEASEGVTRGARPRVPVPPATRAAAPDSAAEPPPARELVLIPATPLRPATRYLVELGRITNINGLSGGGGSVEFTTPEPPPPDTAGAGVARDTIPPDTARPPPRPRR